jgi:hypothetical protein
MGRTKGSKNKTKQLTDNSTPLVQEKKERNSKVSTNSNITGGIKHGLCGKIWPTADDKCPHCYPTN